MRHPSTLSHAEVHAEAHAEAIKSWTRFLEATWTPSLGDEISTLQAYLLADDDGPEAAMLASGLQQPRYFEEACIDTEVAGPLGTVAEALELWSIERSNGLELRQPSHAAYIGGMAIVVALRRTNSGMDSAFQTIGGVRSARTLMTAAIWGLAQPGGGAHLAKFEQAMNATADLYASAARAAANLEIPETPPAILRALLQLVRAARQQRTWAMRRALWKTRFWMWLEFRSVGPWRHQLHEIGVAWLPNKP